MCNRGMIYAVILSLTTLGGTCVFADIVITPTHILGASSDFTTGADRSAIHTIDGSGLTAGTPWATHSTDANGVAWMTNGTQFSPTDPLPAYIVFDLGGNYDLTGTHVWNYNESAGNDYQLLGAKDVTISVATSVGGAFTPVAFTYLGNPATQFQMATGAATYAGETYGLTANNVAAVRFDIASDWGNWYYQEAGLSEVKFIGSVHTVTPEPSTLVLVATGIIGLLCYAWRKRK